MLNIETIEELKIGIKVGKSSFYGIQVPTEKLLAESLKYLGYHDIETKIVRKRNSKKELYEYCVSATWS